MIAGFTDTEIEKALLDATPGELNSLITALQHLVVTCGKAELQKALVRKFSKRLEAFERLPAGVRKGIEGQDGGSNDNPLWPSVIEITPTK